MDNKELAGKLTTNFCKSVNLEYILQHYPKFKNDPINFWLFSYKKFYKEITVNSLRANNHNTGITLII